MRWGIIILNWNGWEDTIECLASLWQQSFRQFDVILIDNHSTDDSIARIREWARQPVFPESSQFYFEKLQPLPPEIEFIPLSGSKKALVRQPLANPVIFYVANEQNLGFAGGTNQGIQLAREMGYTHVLLLNNDTVVDPLALEHLNTALEKYPDFAAYQAAIFYYDDPDRIWNVGGRILPWGQTRYYRKCSSGMIRPTQTLSGCALLLPMHTIHTVGMLNEQFFHGEEDFEYALRLKQAGLSAVVVNTAKVYHKVARSSSKQWSYRRQRLTNAALNRLLHFKHVYPPVVWQVWRAGTLLYYWGLLVFKYRQEPSASFRLILEIGRTVSHIERVTPDAVQAVLKQVK